MKKYLALALLILTTFQLFSQKLDIDKLDSSSIQLISEYEHLPIQYLELTYQSITDAGTYYNLKDCPSPCVVKIQLNVTHTHHHFLFFCDGRAYFVNMRRPLDEILWNVMFLLEEDSGFSKEQSLNVISEIINTYTNDYCIAQTPDTVCYDFHNSTYGVDTVSLDEVLPSTTAIYKLLDAYIQDFSQYEEYQNRTAIVININGGNASSVDFSFVTSYIEYEMLRPIDLLYGCFFYKNKLVVVFEWNEIPKSITQLFKHTGKKFQLICNPEDAPEDDSLYPGKCCWEFRFENGEIRQLKYDGNLQRYN